MTFGDHSLRYLSTGAYGADVLLLKSQRRPHLGQSLSGERESEGHDACSR